MENNKLDLQVGRAISTNRFELWLRRAISVLHKIDVYNRATKLIGQSVVFVMAVVIFVDVFLRYIFHKPIVGSFEIIEVMLVVAVFLGIAHVQSQHAHISVPIVPDALKAKRRVSLNTITCLLTIGIVAMICWQSFTFTQYLMKANRFSPSILIPLWPFALIVFLGCTAMLIVLLRDFLYNLSEGLKVHLSVRSWIITFAITALLMVGLALWAQQMLVQISLPVLGIIGIAVLLILMFTGMPVAFVIALTSFIFISHISGLSAGFDILGSSMFQGTAQFTWSVLALFTLMGYICFHSGMGADAFWAADKWVGQIHGGIGIGTVIGCTAFAAVVGDPTTAAVSVGSVAIPEMRKYRYSDELSTGAVLAGGTIGAMIPPSIGFILYGILSGTSVSALFIAGIIPGLLLCFAFSVLIYILCRINPKLGPTTPGIRSWRERFISLRAAGPIFLLCLIIIGGIYLGVFTPNEGGGIGAFGAFVLALAMKRLSWKRFLTILSSTGSVISMMFVVIASAYMLTYFLALSTLPDMIVNLISGLNVPPLLVILAMLVTYLVLGCLIHAIPILLLTIPVFAPIAKNLGLDPIWVGVLIILMSDLGFITPPFASSIFLLRGLFPQIPIQTMYRGVIPFAVATLVVVGIVVAFPSLATWMPSLMK